jgi:hypothetical protein
MINARVIITHDILGSNDPPLQNNLKHHLASKYSGAASLKVALPLSFRDSVS